MSPPSQPSPPRARVHVSPQPAERPPRAVPLRVVPSPATGASTLARLGAKTVLVGLGEGRMPFALVESKLAVPAAGPAAVSRTALVNRLRALAEQRVVAIVAPAGYGKTTVCAQWVERDRRPCAWVTVDERDNDPVLFLRHLASAVDRAVGLERGALDDLARPDEPSWNGALPRLLAALTSAPGPLLVVLDDAHLIRSGDAASALALLPGHLPPGSTLAVTGRRAPRLPLARLRVAGEIAELDASHLRFTARETALAVRALGAELAADELTALRRRSEGWPAGVHVLAAGPGGGQSLVEYFRAEVVAGLTEGERAFARRTSILDRLSAPLCRAVVGAPRSTGRRLETLVDEGAFLVPIDRERRWFRYHPLFREFLRRELEADEPELVPDLYLRAADWHEAHGDGVAAVAAAQAAGDTDRVARLVGSLAVAAYCAGELETVGGWFDRLAEWDSLHRHPAVAAVGAWVSAIRGRTAEAEQLLASAERRRRDALPDGTPLVALVSLARAALCNEGIEQMRVDAESAAAALPAGSRLLPSALAQRGVALLLAGATAAADDAFTEACDAAEQAGAPVAHSTALAERSLLAGGRGDHAAADAFARMARDIIERAGLDSYPTRAIELAASARAALRHGRWEEARSELDTADGIVPRLTLPPLGVQARLELGRVYLALRDAAGARRMLAEARELLERHSGLGTLTGHAQSLAHELAELERESNGSASGLTAAELRLLPLLATHLSFREIGERLFVSRNTIKTQAISVYRKFGVSTRSAAIARAEQLGLVETGAPAGEITPSG